MYRATSFLFLAVLLVAMTGCSPQPAANPTPPANAPARNEENPKPELAKPAERIPDKTVFQNAIYLMPVGPEGTMRRKGEEVAADLLSRVAADKDSQALLQGLYIGHRAEFLAAKEGEDVGVQAPSKGMEVTLRAAIRPKKDEHSERKGHVYAHFTVARASTANWTPVAVTSIKEALEMQPDDLDVFLFLVNDYLLRKEPGWQIYQNPSSADDIELPQGGLDEIKAELQKKIEEYVKKRTPGRAAEVK